MKDTFSVRAAAKGLLCFLLLVGMPAAAQHYPIVPVPGSPQNIGAIFEDSRGRIWVGSDTDLLCFDGQRFYSMHPYGFPKEMVLSITEDSEGGIWLATGIGRQYGMAEAGGIYRFDGQSFEKLRSGRSVQVLSVAPGIVLGVVNTFYLQHLGDLYLFREHDHRWKSETMAKNLANPLHLGPNGRLAFGCKEGWCEFSTAQIQNWPAAGSEPVRHPITTTSNFTGSTKVLLDRFGCVWIKNGSVSWSGCAKDGSVERLPSDFAAGNDYDVLAESKEGKIVALGEGYLTLGRPGHFVTAGAANGVPEDLRAAMFGSDGTLWLGGGNGLYRFSYPLHLEYWDQNNGVEHPNTILRVGDAMFSGGRGISKLDANRRQWNALPGTGLLGTVRSLKAGTGGDFYAAASAHGISLLNSAGTVLATTSPEATRAFGVTVDDQQDVWLAAKGIFKVTRQGSSMNLDNQNLGIESSLDIQFDAQRHAIWACNWHTVQEWRNGQWTSFGSEQGVEGLKENFCQTLAVHPNGDVWMAYGGLEEFSLLRPRAGTTLNVVNFHNGGEVGAAHTNFLGWDSRGWLWRGGDSENYVATATNAEAGSWLRLNELDGIPVPGGNQNAFLADHDGSVWWGSGNSIVHFLPPESFAATYPKPKIFISGYSVGRSQPFWARSKVKVQHGQDLVAYLGSPQFDRRNAIRLRYRLMPDQQEWHEARELYLNLGKLHFGAHTLQVQARMGNGGTASAWSPVEEQTFTVLKPLWLMWPVLGGVAVTLAAGTYGGQLWRAKRRERTSKLLPELAGWRLEALSPELRDLQGLRLDGRFEVGTLIASGGFGLILAGRDLQNAGRPCAIKIFRHDLMDKDWMARRFEQEVRALERINHPNVVKIHGSGTTPAGAAYLVMEYIEGDTLRQRMDVGRIPRRQLAAWLRQAGSALHAIHSHNVCHRDLKPENIMLRSQPKPDEELVLIDFSIAIVQDPDETMHGLSRAAGTLSYMAPEQAIGYADFSTDIYSLARILIELLAGERLSALLPHASLDLPQQVLELLSGMEVTFSRASLAMIATALEFDPGRRPKDVQRFVNTVAPDLER